ncbi:Oligopeptide transporter OPT superfamily [Cynara cardunculus var. scolymus]|uniref:Oligopeptide transporter OPT superfamily n=1 Tax=Cynara cardunculus var. scolymus TaxID=59895 RepID=A0A118JRX7_CYNCS|nr:Oligopeptide transporter OPT superfamily [Cynara cardunculus var. scolymus]
MASRETEEDNVNESEAAAAMERVFSNKEVPSWRNQITIRAIVTSFILSIIFSFIVCKLNLTTGVIPSLNVAAGLLGFAMIKAWTELLNKCGLLKQPFTRQENTVIQTCVVASSGIAFSSGTANYLLGMSPLIAGQLDTGNTPHNVKKLALGWMIAYLFVVSFVGLFSIVPLRRMMIMKLKLTYPSGTATAYLINSFHTPKGAKLANLFPKLLNLNFESYRRFYFDFSSTYVGVGMICPYMVNISLLVGAIMSWGIMWPIIESKKGIWYAADLSASSLHGIQGYRVFLAVATMLGDGLFHVIYIAIVMLFSFISHKSKIQSSSPHEDKPVSFDEQKRNEYFDKDQISNLTALGGYVILAIISIIVVPHFIFRQIKWYHMLVAYIIAPILAFCNAYGCGLTDWSLASNYGKLAILIFSGWVGLQNGGIIAGLAACGVMMNIVSTASDLMQDFKTGYLTLSSPRSMFFSQVLGTAMGCVMSPLVFWFFYRAYSVGDPTGSYPAPYGALYRGIALLGVEGFGSLPHNCVKLSIGFFLGAFLVNLLTVILQRYEKRYRLYRFIPSPMCMAIPFYLGSYFAIDMCVGSLILFVWEKMNKKGAKELAPAVASGLICGDSLWGVPGAILSMAGVKAPICMKFLSASTNKKVDSFLGG